MHVLILAAALATAPPLPEALSLPRALELARTRNEVPAIAATRVAQARAALREARAELLPGLALEVSATRRSDEITRRIDQDEVVLQSRDALRGAVTAEAWLFDPSALPRVRGASRAAEAAELEASELNRALAFDTAEAFFAVLSSEQVLDAAVRRRSVAEDTVQDARDRLEAGLAARNELTRSELELSAARLSETTARNLVRTSRLSLGLLLAEDVDEPLLPPPAEAAPSRPAEGIPERDDLKAAALRVEAAHFAAREPWMELVPSLRLRGTWTATDDAGLNAQSRAWNVAAVVGWVLWDGGIRQARAAALEASRQELDLQAGALRRQAAHDVRRALADLETAEAALSQAQVAARVAGDNAEEVAELFAQGLATALERADANVSRFEAETGVARQGFARETSRLNLLQALGRWPAPEAAP